MEVNPQIRGLKELREATERIDKKWLPNFLRRYFPFFAVYFQEEKEAARLESLLQIGMVRMMSSVYTSEDIIPKIQARIDTQEDYDWTDEEISARRVIAEVREWCFGEIPFYILKGARSTLEEIDAFAAGEGFYTNFDSIQQFDFRMVDERQVFTDPDYGIEMVVTSRKDRNGKDLPLAWTNSETHCLGARPTALGLAQLGDVVAEVLRYIEQLKEGSHDLHVRIEETISWGERGSKAMHVLIDSFLARVKGRD